MCNLCWFCAHAQPGLFLCVISVVSVLIINGKAVWLPVNAPTVFVVDKLQGKEHVQMHKCSLHGW